MISKKRGVADDSGGAPLWAQCPRSVCCDSSDRYMMTMTGVWKDGGKRGRRPNAGHTNLNSEEFPDVVSYHVVIRLCE